LGVGGKSEDWRSLTETSAEEIAFFYHTKVVHAKQE
jgi:hypothetical protein